ncbi:class I SAM-dependent methyltransferase [Streptomyces venezuelae]|uniref:class I SAM-dependent methyltransferase n=1 Tax=Streptomyces venezuelae TaxID=54571 RepID=UPI00341E21FC
MDAAHWDDMYRSRDQLFSGNPNGVLTTEIPGLPPGRALDVGCGEGADALWLARQGWRVTAVDISEVALRRAATTAAAEGLEGRVTWERTDLSSAPPRAGAYDLVSLQYFPLRRQDDAALHGLLDAVAPGGTLLFVTHTLADLAGHGPEDFDPADYYWSQDIAPLLDAASWTVLTDEDRPRTTPPPAGTPHTHDGVLRALRLP